jgi:hypothetical protein
MESLRSPHSWVLAFKGKTMKIVRILAECLEGGVRFGNYKFVLICGLNEHDKIENGEWLGYLRNDEIHYPFLLKNKSCFYGGEEHESEPTNIVDKVIELGGQFTIFNGPGNSETWESTYEIISCHEYQS